MKSPAVSRGALLAGLVMAAMMLPGSEVNAQDTPADSAASSAASTETPAADATTQPPEVTPAEKLPIEPVPQAEPAAVQPVQGDPAANAGCLPEILAQQQKTRTLRDLRDQIKGPTKEDYDKVRRPYVKLLEEGYGAADVKTVQTCLEYRMFQVTDPEFVLSPSNTANLNREMANEVAKCGSKIGNAGTKRTARRKFCLEVLTVAKRLLTNNLDSRYSALSIIMELYEEVPPPGEGKATLLKEALDTVLEVMNDPEQPDSVKVRAASALENMLRNCTIAPQDQDRISDALGAQLARPCSEVAYQIVLIETLVLLNQPLRTVGAPEPLAMKHFAAVLNDKTRPLEVRCHAAIGVGRGAWHDRFKADPLAWKIADLAVETGVRFTQAGHGDPVWHLCGGDLFFAYRGADTSPLEGTKGLLNRAANSAVVKESAELVLTVAIKVLENNAAVPIDDIQKLATWRDQKKPADLRWDSNAPALDP